MIEAISLTRGCWQPWESVNIAADGKVYPCCVVHESLEIGDLSSNTLHEIIHGDPALRIKRKLLLGEISDLPCLDCPNGPILAAEDFARDLAERYQIAGNREKLPGDDFPVESYHTDAREREGEGWHEPTQAPLTSIKKFASVMRSMINLFSPREKNGSRNVA